jgi:hypothetical protein
LALYWAAESSSSAARCDFRECPKINGPYQADAFSGYHSA